MRKCCDNCVRHILGDASSNVSERLQVALTFPNGCKLGAPWPCHSRQPLSGVPACDAVCACVCACARAHTYPQSRSPPSFSPHLTHILWCTRTQRITEELSMRMSAVSPCPDADINKLTAPSAAILWKRAEALFNLKRYKCYQPVQSMQRMQWVQWMQWMHWMQWM